MKKNENLLCALYTLVLLSTSSIVAMEKISNPVLYVIPGQNGCGCERCHVNEVFGCAADIEVPTPQSQPDLGQERCIKHLRDTLKAHPEHQNVVVYAVSQGTATVLNYLAETSDDRIKCIILQAPLMSGNSAILHTLREMIKLPRLANLPFAHYWLPYCAKALFPYYWPAGKQPIKSIQKITRDIPTIIVHAKDDPQLPFAGACALYYGLRSQGKNNVYLISKENGGHMFLLKNSDRSVLNTILAKHLNQHQELAVDDLTAYQPDHRQFKAHYDDLMFKENNHTYLKYAAIAACAATTAYLLRNRIAPVLSKVAPVVRKACHALRAIKLPIFLERIQMHKANPLAILHCS